MGKEIIFDNGKYIDPTDWQGKYDEVIEYLNNEIFDRLEEIINGTPVNNQNNNNDIGDLDKMFQNQQEPKVTVKKTFGKHDIMPTLTPMQITSRLNRVLRVYKPMNIDEAKNISDEEYLKAFGFYCDIISYINQYVVFLPDKQTFCAFVNITTDVYNEMLNNPNYSSVFKSFEDSFIQSNFSAAQSGLVSGNVTVSKLQTRDAGHNLIKNPDNITFNVTNKIDKQQINNMLGKYDNLLKIGKGGK